MLIWLVVGTLAATLAVHVWLLWWAVAVDVPVRPGRISGSDTR